MLDAAAEVGIGVGARAEHSAHSPTSSYNPVPTHDCHPTSEPDKRLVLNRLRRVRDGDVLFPGQVGDCARHIDDPVVGPDCTAENRKWGFGIYAV